MNTRAEHRRAAREDKRLDQYVRTGFWPFPANVMHGVCRRCRGHRTYLTLPLAICKPCVGEAFALRWAAAFFGAEL